ncbi:MAG TPA: hypothetical protein VML55_02520 [Planctomycetaceae bacterium]|nr:hypothetical protein [Planctomycetaceae bacterium]
MSDKPRRVKRVLTAEERERYKRLRDEIESEREEIIARGRQYRAECDALPERDGSADRDRSA